MRPKSISQLGSWVFFMEDPEGNEVQIPPAGSLNTVDQLAVIVLQYFNTYDDLTQGEYSKIQRQFAEEKGMSFLDYIKELILHQVCVRNRGVIDCWNDGVGDAMHEQISKLDKFVTVLPKTLRETAERVTQALTPSHVKTFSNCEGCGGTRMMKRDQNNLGRAGTLNTLLKKKKKKGKDKKGNPEV